MKKPTLTCTTPHGTFTRGTHRPYTHVVVGIRADNKGVDLSWHGTEFLAVQSQTYWRNRTVAKSETSPVRIEVFPVDVEAPRPRSCGRLLVGSRVHYSGDMANASGWFKVVRVREGARITYDLDEIGGHNREFRGTFVDPDDVYAGHCAPRFVTREAYDAYMAKRAEAIR